MQNYDLKKPFILTSLLVIFIDIFGPYLYKDLSWGGLAYYTVCSLLLICGLSLKRIRVAGCHSSKYEKKYCHRTLNKSGVLIIKFFSLVSLAATIMYFLLLVRQAGSLWIVGKTDERYLIANARSMITRFLEIAMWCAAPSYLVATNVDNQFSKMEKGLFFISFWATPVFYLFFGARFSLMYHLIIFYINKRMNSTKKRHINVVKIQKKKIVIGIIVGVLLLYLLNIVLKLFANRGNTDIYVQFLNNEGDMEPRSVWVSLYELSGGVLAPIYKIFQYFGHSIPNLCYILSEYNDSFLHTYGLTFFSFIRYFLILLGKSDGWVKEIILSYPGAGSYKTYLNDLIIDGGIILAPILCFGVGYMFSRIEINAERNMLARVLYPISWACMFCAPIGGIWVSSSQMNMLILVFYFALFKLFHTWALRTPYQQNISEHV